MPAEGVFHNLILVAIRKSFDPRRDIEFAMGPVDSLDHASRLANFGSKMGIDATRK